MIIFINHNMHMLDEITNTHAYLRPVDHGIAYLPGVCLTISDLIWSMNQ
jgi:hypothetical protein